MWPICSVLRTVTAVLCTVHCTL